MRSRKLFAPFGLVLAASAIVLASGCAQVKPCMIIPAQIELAESKRDQAKRAYEDKLEDVSRSKNNLEVSLGRLERLVEEKNELESILGEGGDQ
ncbi:MAG: hypothetical protein KDA27_08665 [Candidatus Eisenbacteria bacterium]|uniref:Uncharacterized protein n=1 Tax=Eiseniibacteriota bacterium TaxID=2212470 RepID=A0A956SF10_UNCEI|nr:hypothetical protein [Candidatus Eisenbacteria bacterium]MCB9463133.1 hypothetical protein [Candidatus Eisenbacteria bacterium]